MAKRSSIPHYLLLLLLLALISLLSLLTVASDFEGFDADELYEEDDEFFPSQPLKPSSPPSTPLTQSSTPESHHGPPVTPSTLSPASDPIPKPSTLDFWDEDEFEGIPQTLQTTDPIPSPQSPPSDPTPPKPSPPKSLKSYTVEIVCVSFLIVFIINFFIGKRQNELIALCWASRFATKDSIFDKNFSLLGTGEGKEDNPLLLKEGQDVFKFYASGRRYCQGLLATMELKSRHDLISRIVDLVVPRKDTITFEVMMNDDAMDHVVMALARRKTAKGMHKELRDLQKFGSLMMNPPSGRRWVAEELMVVSESREVAGDLITEVVLDQVIR